MKPVAATLLEAGIVKTIDVSLHDGTFLLPRDPASRSQAAERAAVVLTRPRALPARPNGRRPARRPLVPRAFEPSEQCSFRSGRGPAPRRRPRGCAGSTRVLPAAWPAAGRRLAKFAQRSGPDSAVMTPTRPPGERA